MTVTRYTCTDIEAKATAARIEGNAVGGGKSSQKSDATSNPVRTPPLPPNPA